MNPLIIKATEDTPEIVFDADKGIFRISKISVPENAVEFYQPLLDWLDEYEKNPNPETVIEFDLEYVNTASSKQLIQVIMRFQKIARKSKLKIKWMYEEIDEDMENLGRRYQKLTNLDFDFVITTK